MLKLNIELPDDLGKYVEFIPQADLNLMFADMLRQRINGDIQPVVIQAPPEPVKVKFDEEEFFGRLERMLAERTVVGTTPQPKTKEDIKQTFESLVVSPEDEISIPESGDSIMDEFLMSIMK